MISLGIPSLARNLVGLRPEHNVIMLHGNYVAGVKADVFETLDSKPRTKQRIIAKITIQPAGNAVLPGYNPELARLGSVSLSGGIVSGRSVTVELIVDGSTLEAVSALPWHFSFAVLGRR